MRKHYGDGNLPFGLYKLVTYGTESDGWTVDGDYTQYGVYKVAFSTNVSTNDGRDIFAPDAFAKACGYDDDAYYYSANRDTLFVTTTAWRWVVSGGYYDSNLYALASEEGCDGWDAVDVD